eukprot:2259327-Prymnesium_polylepis.1
MARARAREGGARVSAHALTFARARLATEGLGRRVCAARPGPALNSMQLRGGAGGGLRSWTCVLLGGCAGPRERRERSPTATRARVFMTSVRPGGVRRPGAGGGGARGVTRNASLCLWRGLWGFGAWVRGMVCLA